jgi:hypothetical protein
MNFFKVAEWSDGDLDNENIYQITMFCNFNVITGSRIIDVKLKNGNQYTGYFNYTSTGTEATLTHSRGEISISQVNLNDFHIDMLDIEQINIVEDKNIIENFRKAGLFVTRMES